jgi:hypothetical protein
MDTHDQHEIQAEKIGHDAGIAAASWVFGERTTLRTYAWYAAGIADGDPEVMDSLNEPSLSGEYSGDYTSSDLMFDLGIEHEETEYQDQLCEVWNQAASSAFWGEVERIARRNNPDEIVTRRRDGIAYLMGDGRDYRVPCSRYGRWTSDCAPVAWRIAYLTAREIGDAITQGALDAAMSLVVNDSDDVAYMVRTYGHRMYR